MTPEQVPVFLNRVIPLETTDPTPAWPLARHVFPVMAPLLESSAYTPPVRLSADTFPLTVNSLQDLRMIPAAPDESTRLPVTATPWAVSRMMPSLAVPPHDSTTLELTDPPTPAK